MANGTATFDGGGATPIANDRVVVTTGACNACHGKLQIHGRRVDAQYCTTCHTAQIATGGVSGNGNFSYMVHGLHAARQMGLNYSIAGVIGAEITYPQDVRNCDHLSRSRPDRHRRSTRRWSASPPARDATRT